MSDRLCIVMPVYNEQDAIGGVLEKWSAALDALDIDYVIRPYNDGSKDNSLQVMRQFAEGKPRIEVRDKNNGGHGHTILTGYRDAVADGFDWVFQIDSDDEMGPEKFNELWARRNENDFLVGIRDGRKQALPRKIISFVSRLVVRLFYGTSIWDVNTPYRLMRASSFAPFYAAIPSKTFAPNVILSGLSARHHLRCFETRVPQHDRTTGEVSIKKWKLLKAAAKSFCQTIVFALKTASMKNWCEYALYAGLIALATASVVAGVKNGLRFVDFQWCPAKILMNGENPYNYSLNHISFDGCQVDANQVPSCLFLLAPFSLFPRMVANGIWDCCNLVFTVLFFVFLYKSFFTEIKRERFALVVLLILAGTPWRVLIGNGQHLMFSLSFFMMGYYYAQQKRDWLAGVLLAISFFKYTSVAPLFFVFFALKQYRPVVIAAGLHLMATLGVGLALHENPVTLVLQSLQVGGALTGAGVADLASLLHVFGCSDVRTVAMIGYAVFAALIVLVTFTGKRDPLLKLAILAIISNVMFYHRVYDFVMLVFPMVLCSSGSFRRIAFGKVVCLLVMANVVWFLYGGRSLPPKILCSSAFSLQHLLLAFLIWAHYTRNERYNLV